ncbi:MAG: hypothetical protein M3162_09435 [Thermoproteota archaeon]|nr:hypothetical protein [Thermoproteota archaeon]
MLNSYEIAILRILIKRSNQPIAIHSLIDGFPDGSEKHVSEAISNLHSMKLVNILSGYPVEEKYVVYSLEKKNEILKVIDPFSTKKIAGKYNDANDPDHDDSDAYATTNKMHHARNSTNRLPAIALSIVFIITGLFLINVIPEVNETNHGFFSKNYNNDLNHNSGDGGFGIDKNMRTGEAYGDGYKHFAKNMNANTTDWTTGKEMSMVEESSNPDRFACQSI